jgi:hypothetical protein
VRDIQFKCFNTIQINCRIVRNKSKIQNNGNLYLTYVGHEITGTITAFNVFVAKRALVTKNFDFGRF